MRIVERAFISVRSSGKDKQALTQGSARLSDIDEPFRPATSVPDPIDAWATARSSGAQGVQFRPHQAAPMIASTDAVTSSPLMEEHVFPVKAQIGRLP